MTAETKQDAYCYPNEPNDPDRTDVLRNRFDLRTHSELRPVEYRQTAFRIAEIREGEGPVGRFDAEHLKAIHRHIFQDVYEWAGHTRDERLIVDGRPAEPIGDMAKGETEFLHGSRVDRGLYEALKPIRDPDVLNGSTPQQFAERAGQVLGELNFVHPFREGNGRAQETFIAELGRAYGHDVEFAVITKARMIEVSRETVDDPSSTAMEHLVLDATDPNRRAALRQGFAHLERYGETPMEHDLRTALPGESIAAEILGHSELVATLLTDNGVVVADRADLPDRLPADGGDVTFAARSDFSRLGPALAYLESSRADAARDSGLRRAVTFEAYVERKLRDQYPDDPQAVDRGLAVTRDRIAGMIARGDQIPEPQVIHTRDHKGRDGQEQLRDGNDHVDDLTRDDRPDRER